MVQRRVINVSSSAYSALLIDRHGRLWIETLNQGLNLYDDRTQRFYHIDMSDLASPDVGNYGIILLAEDPEGNIWVGASQNKLVKITLSDSLRNVFPQQADTTVPGSVQPIFISVIWDKQRQRTSTDQLSGQWSGGG